MCYNGFDNPAVKGNRHEGVIKGNRGPYTQREIARSVFAHMGHFFMQ